MLDIMHLFFVVLLSALHDLGLLSFYLLTYAQPTQDQAHVP
jgi:hypothetical protein